MKCPIDSNTLLMSDKKGVEIDYCPECRGVWLDRGELEKLIQQDAEQFTDSRTYQTDKPRPEASNRHHDGDYYPHSKKKKSSFLGEIFDF